MLNANSFGVSDASSGTASRDDFGSFEVLDRVSQVVIHRLFVHLCNDNDNTGVWFISYNQFFDDLNYSFVETNNKHMILFKDLALTFLKRGYAIFKLLSDERNHAEEKNQFYENRNDRY